MPLTLEKLFSPTVPSSLVVMGETVHLLWAPSRYTGEMDELADHLATEEAQDSASVAMLEAEGDEDGAAALKHTMERKNAAAARTFVAQLLVSWDVLDGKDPIPFDEASLKRLPDFFVIAVFLAMSEENATDPTNAPSSNGTSAPKASSARSPRGSPSSGARKSSKSRRGK